VGVPIAARADGVRVDRARPRRVTERGRRDLPHEID
jgi:hypothetical protein